MIIKDRHRPWQRKKSQGRRYNPDPYYQSSSWRNLRSDFREGFTVLEDGRRVSNKFCLDCFKEGSLIPGSNTDHIVSRKEGGKDEKENLQTQCNTCHAKKSANEGKKFKGK